MPFITWFICMHYIINEKKKINFGALKIVLYLIAYHSLPSNEDSISSIHPWGQGSFQEGRSLIRAYACYWRWGHMWWNALADSRYSPRCGSSF